MNTWVIVAIVVVAVIVIAAIAYAAYRKRQSDRLQERFGSEYDRTLEREGSKRDAERRLQERAEEHDKLDIRPLSRTQADSYVRRWRDVQAEFLDHPTDALASADALVADVMAARGYPVEQPADASEHIDLVAMDHDDDVVKRYREGRRLYVRSVTGDATTEDARNAMLAYREVFDGLVSDTRQEA
ncbi:MAG TPA: hypothetical protein VHN98_06810 [Acidimicrobiales bacterium]|nr:hypothetical protein [Acidimicrobiales bacterium]